MKVIVAEHSGFCFGVAKAIKVALETVDQNDNVMSLGPVIHNKQVINKLKDKGLVTTENLDEAQGKKLIIRSHGVPLEVYTKAEAQKSNIIDTTCPFVRNIQKKVNEYYKKDYQIIIIGDPKHPEVVGINGWCHNKAYIVNEKDDIEDIPKCDKICIVAQTTMTRHKFEDLSHEISKHANEVKVFNTICSATKLRQDACKEIASKVDAMIIIGGYHSSNTRKLAEISGQYCKSTYHIETAKDLSKIDLNGFKSIGITAGASTPDWIIKEVVSKVNSNDNEMMNMMEEIEKSMKDLKTGEVVEGKVISVNADEVMVNIGYKADGIINRKELSYDPSLDPRDVIKPGDKIDVLIRKLDDGEGNVLLSKKRVDDIKGWEQAEASFERKEVVEAKVVEVVKGGVIALIQGLRGFIPASHLSMNYVEDLNEYLNKSFEVEIIEFNKDKKRVVLSRKQIELKEAAKKKEKLMNSLEKGQIIEGEVKRLTSFGAFVDVGGMDGLVHISELSWGRVKHPSDVVSEGQKVEVIVLDFDKAKEKISLGLKQTKPHPWDNIQQRYNVGDIVDGKVVRLVDFGAFVELEQGIDGLVHISQISDQHIAKPSEVLSVGELISVKILDIKEEEQRISLSIKEVIAKKDEENYVEDKEPDVTIGDVLENQE